ncbi:MAG: hypothetical protein ACWA6Y_06915 [Polaromonas sp.]
MDLQIRLGGRSAKFQALLDRVEVMQHQRLGRGHASGGHGLHPQRMVIASAAHRSQ